LDGRFSIAIGYKRLHQKESFGQYLFGFPASAVPNGVVILEVCGVGRRIRYGLGFFVQDERFLFLVYTPTRALHAVLSSSFSLALSRLRNVSMTYICVLRCGVIRVQVNSPLLLSAIGSSIWSVRYSDTRASEDRYSLIRLEKGNQLRAPMRLKKQFGRSTV